MKKLFSILLLIAALHSTAQDYKQFPMWNTSLSFEQRVNDVVSRLTLEEKVNQMLNAAPAIPRLGIIAYDWWNEVLHGVARTPFKVTSYPQAIGMAAEDCELISILNSDDHYQQERFARCIPLLEGAPEKSVLCTALNIIESVCLSPGPSGTKRSRLELLELAKSSMERVTRYGD